jgi:hypothetical protein
MEDGEEPMLQPSIYIPSCLTKWLLPVRSHSLKLLEKRGNNRRAQARIAAGHLECCGASLP